MTKSMSRYGFLQNLAFPFNIFAMVEVAMALPNKTYQPK